MKVNNLKVSVMIGFVGLTSFLVTSCTDDDTPNTPSATTDGISFSVNDVQAVKNEPSLQMTKAPQVYETQTTPLLGRDAEGLQLVETTVEGVNPIYYPAESRGTITTKDNFATINKPFTIFACKNGSTTANYLYGQEVNADGTMKNAVKWRKSEAAGLKFYAVHPAPTASNITTTSGQNPIIKFSPDADAKKQTDLLVAATDNYNYDDYVNTKIPITFNHATTAIFFKVGNDLSYNRKVTKIEILNVIGEGTYDIAQKKWTLGTTKKSYALTLAQPFSTAVQPGATMNGGDGIFFMIPQTLPTDAQVKISFESGDPVIAKIGGKDKNGHDKVWAEGTTKTYTISNSKAVDDREYTLTITAPTAANEYNNTSMPFTVQSYKTLKNETTGRKIAEPWEVVSYEYRQDNGTWTTASATKPSMVTAITENGKGGSSAQSCNMTITNDYQDFVAYRNKQLKEADVAEDKDLSLINGRQYTANCYIVSAPGTYKFPLFYGSSRVNGEPTGTGTGDVAESFTNNNPDVQGMAIKRFKGGIEQSSGNYEIPYADIHQWVQSASVLWESKPNLVKVTAIDRNNKPTGSEGGRDKYVKFEVNKNNIEMGNAIIAVWYDDKIAWTWHIWITGKDVTDVPSGEFMREPIGFIPSTWKRTTYNDTREVRVTIKQKNSGKTASAVFTQKSKVDQAQGMAMFYQWGRKDPFWPGMTGMSTSENKYSGGITLETAVQNPQMMGHHRKFYSRINELADHHEFWGDTFDWNSDPAEARTYVNLWDANASGYEGNNTGTTFVKTIYDPSPAQFHVPRAADFSKMTPGLRKAALRMGDINPGDATPPIPVSPSHENSGYGYYWTSEKIYTLHNGGTWAYYAVHAYAVNDNDLEIQRGRQYYTDMRFGYNILPIKQ